MTRLFTLPEDSTRRLVEIETILPAAMAQRAEEGGVKRAGMDPLNLFVLSLLAGAFIAFGAVFATTVSSASIAMPGGAAPLPFGLVRLLTGVVFSVGLLMVVIAGAELFTGNNMIVMAWASGKVTTGALLRNWGISYAGNCIGAIAAAGLVFISQQYTSGGGAVGLSALATANAKANLDFVPALALGILCNALVCLAVWMCHAARTTIDRVVTIVPPVAAFVACGFEHSIANVYFLPMGLFIKQGAPASFWNAVDSSPANFAGLTWDRFLFGNLLPVTIGNIIGGSLMVAAVYWFVYLRGNRTVARAHDNA
jgi:formate/nitrite transporter